VISKPSHIEANRQQYEKYVYAPNIVLAIFQTPKAAENLINASPLQVRVNSRLSSEPSPSHRTTTSPQAPQEPTIWTPYSVTVTPSYDDHAKRAEKNPYSGHWQPQHTVSYEDLVKDVPLKEYGDCSTTRYDLDTKTLHALRKEADAQEGLMDMWRRGLEKKEGMKP
jgi:hypothetical protein